MGKIGKCEKYEKEIRRSEELRNRKRRRRMVVRFINGKKEYRIRKR